MAAADCPELDRCLAFVVADDWATWLGRPSPTDLAVLLSGAAERAYFLAVDLPQWPIFGPLASEDCETTCWRVAPSASRIPISRATSHRN